MRLTTAPAARLARAVCVAREPGVARVARQSVVALALTFAFACSPGATLPPIPNTPRELGPSKQLDHALARLSFGPRPTDFEQVRRAGVDRWIERQLHPERIPDTLVERLLARDTLLLLDQPALHERLPSPSVQRRAYDRELKAAGVKTPAEAADSAVQQRLRRDSVAWTQAGRASYALFTGLERERLLRAAYSERQLQEVMTDFWENHFSVWVGKGEPMRYLLVPYDREVIRPRALGKFRELLGAVAHSPAMLYYLDNWRNGADREQPTLAQLECEARIPAVRLRPATSPGPRPPGAPLPGPGRVRAGVERVDQEREKAQCARRRSGPGRNENYARELMELHTLGVNGGYTQQDVIEVARAFSGWTIRAPDSLAVFEFNPAMHDAGPKTVLGHAIKGGGGENDGEQVLDILARQPATARFLATKLVRHFVADDPPPALVQRAADAYLASDGDMRTVLRTIFRSPEFWTREAFRARLKTPLELVASAVRALGAPPDSTLRTLGQVGYLGEPFWGHQFPDGWPDVASGWLGSDAMIRRMTFGASAASGALPGASPDSWRRSALLRLAPATDPAQAVATLVLGDDVAADARALLDSIAAAARPRARATSPASPSGLAGADPALLRRLLALALGSPDFQKH